MKNLNEKYYGKAIITKTDDELFRYEIKCCEGYVLNGTCLMGKYEDDLFEETFENETSVYCYNLREVKSVLSTLKEKEK